MGTRFAYLNTSKQSVALDLSKESGRRKLAALLEREQEWQALCDAAGLEESLRAMDLEARLKRHDAIDEVLSAWTRASEPAELMERLQSIGVIADRPPEDAPLRGV
jgi:crotonobetainyl-CoA:carnitine CoA-transferase CaiB-like acyl-CoA transferase